MQTLAQMFPHKKTYIRIGIFILMYFSIASIFAIISIWRESNLLKEDVKINHTMGVDDFKANYERYVSIKDCNLMHKVTENECISNTHDIADSNVYYEDSIGYFDGCGVQKSKALFIKKGRSGFHKYPPNMKVSLHNYIYILDETVRNSVLKKIQTRELIGDSSREESFILLDNGWYMCSYSFVNSVDSGR